MADCAVCSRPIMDTAYACADDATTLARQLHAAADLLPELDTALARQTRFGEPGPRPRNSAPAESIRLGLLADPESDRALGPAGGLPFSEAASIDRGTVANTMSTWCRVVVDQRGGEHPGELGAAMRWLAGQLGWVRYQPFASEAFDELGHVANLVWRAVDRPVPRVDAGVCLAVDEDGGTCQWRLSAHPGAVVVVCPACRTPHNVQDRRDALLAAARNIRGTATECAQWLTILGIDTTASMVRGLAHRGRVIADRFERYALGEVERCRLEQIEREQRRKVAA